MTIVDLALQLERVQSQAAQLLMDGFDKPGGWRDLRAAREEITCVLREGFARAMLDVDALLGWVGGQPQYNGRVWELHPIVVQRQHRRRGIGRALVEAFESEARGRGALTVTLGTDDDSGMTSLAGIDLYGDVP